MRQTPKKPVELGVVLRHRMARRARGQGGKVMLNRTNLVPEPEWIQRPGQRAEPVLHLGGNRVRRKQPRTRSLRLSTGAEM